MLSIRSLIDVAMELSHHAICSSHWLTLSDWFVSCAIHPIFAAPPARAVLAPEQETRRTGRPKRRHHMVEEVASQQDGMQPAY